MDDIGSFLLLAAILILVALFVGRPIFQHRGSLTTQEDHLVSSLLAERDRIYDALNELDADYDLGKIPEEDYPAQREVLKRNGIEVLKKLDALNISDNGKKAPKKSKPPVVAQQVQAGFPRMVNAPDDDIEALIAVRRRESKETTGGFCAQCGSPIRRSDKFCTRCGVSVT